MAKQERSTLSLSATQEQRDFLYTIWLLNDWSLVTVEPENEDVEQMEVDGSVICKPSDSAIVDNPRTYDLLTSNLVQGAAETMALHSSEAISSKCDSNERHTAISYSDVDQSSEGSSYESESEEAPSEASSSDFDVQELSSEAEFSESESNHCDKCGAVKTGYGAVHYVYPTYRMKQTSNVDVEECCFCLCRPCVIDNGNTQAWWETQVHPPSRLNSKVRKNHYQRFWVMLLHRGAWEKPAYMTKQSAALCEDRRRNTWSGPNSNHPRHIMPKCVLKLIRCWLPNPPCIPYMGHKWT